MFKEIGEESLTTLVLLGSIILIVLVAFVVLLSFLFTTKKNKLIQFFAFKSGKWSMADVMVVAIFMAYIGGG